MTSDRTSIEKCKYDISYTQNREVSWLRFNERVLDEAWDMTVPLYERLKFLSIFNNNLDEFFMIRVGSLSDLALTNPELEDNKTGWTPAQQLSIIFDQVRSLYIKADAAFREIEERMRQFDIVHLSLEELGDEERSYITNYYRTEVLPLLSPQIMSIRHPFPHLVNKALYVGVELRFHGKHNKSSHGKNTFGIIPIPDYLPRILFLQGKGLRYVLLEEIILDFADEAFPMYQLVNKATVCVTRNADITPDDETFDAQEDYRDLVRKVLKKRSRLAPVRIEIQGGTEGDALSDFFRMMLGTASEQTYYRIAPLTMGYVYFLEEKMQPKAHEMLTYKHFTPLYPTDMDSKEYITKQVMSRDILLYYPFDTMEPFLQLMKEASTDPSVVSIKITIYRLSNRSKLVEHLIAAAENNKEVTVMMELRARFDEANNINWAEILEEAGCRIIYGLESFKTHAKICLITRRERDKTQYITQIGTGNYNEQTVKLYTDLSLLTANTLIGEDANEFFKNMAIGNLKGRYKELLVAPSNLKAALMELIDDEIAKVRQGKTGRILIKINSISERGMIDKLAQASQAGVKVDLMVRGICCILPTIAGKTENIRVVSIVGRFLEHLRIYAFGEGDDLKIYIGSSDAMTRNINWRVEVLCPVRDKKCKDFIMHIVDVMSKDNTKARIMQQDGSYICIDDSKNKPVNAQEIFIEEALEIRRKHEADAMNSNTLRSKLKNLLNALKKKTARFVKKE